MFIAGIDAEHAFVAQVDQADNWGGYIYRTSDGGATWTQSGAGVVFDNPPDSFCVGI
jgi:hypothetical protein